MAKFQVKPELFFERADFGKTMRVATSLSHKRRKK
jgi:hypothetical protein